VTWLAAVLLGGIVGLDATSFPQAMYSRPFVAGALAGQLVGRPGEGVMIGLVLELFSLPVLPFGAAGYPEGGTAAVASVIAYDWAAPVLDRDLLFLAVALGLVVSHASGYTVRLLRIRNGRAIGRNPEHAEIPPEAVERGHTMAMVLDFLRGAAVTAAGTAVLALGLGLAVRSGWSLPLPALAVLALAGVMMIGGSLTVFGTVRERIVSFAIGAAVTAAVVLAF
jgi:mannose/fructose/N-acetylgalactosamine-specific phosphotransferase system component IIC